MNAGCRTAALAPITILAGACAPRPTTAGGREIERLYDIFSVIAAIVFIVTAGLILWSMLRYRRKRADDALPRQTHTNVALEVVWFAIPQLIVVGLFVLSVQTLGRVDEPPAEAGAAPLVVEVEGFQWGWRFSFPDAGVTVTGIAQDDPVVVLPVDVPIVFELASRDVIHSFYVPRFLTKRDVVPGHDNALTITIEEEGVYEGKCAEFCGLLHAEMNFEIRAVPEEEFRTWLEEVARGE
ncbi:MAG TPA: cytochrome c oxidase subunit II [Actinomycetota bacterium]|nr:cytochrome c oxidase subunit II [Actinomycetota bacterium]